MSDVIARDVQVIDRVKDGFEDDFSEKPFIIFWELTRACALACRHCRAKAQSTRDVDELDTKQSIRLIHELASWHPPMLVLTGGDPLMRSDALTLVREASDLGLHVGLSPSATQRLLNCDFAELVNSGVQRMSLSLDGATKETHDSFRGLIGTFDRTIEAVRRAHDVGLSLQINTTITRGNLREYEAFKDLICELKPAMWSVFIVVPTGRAGLDDLPLAEEIERLFEDLAEMIGKVPFGIKTTEGHHFRRVLAQKYGIETLADQRGMRSPIGIRDGRGVMFISHQGDMMPSGFLPLICGNVKDQSVVDVYQQSPLFVSLRDHGSLLGKCGRCEYRAICGGSRSRAYGATGDPFAEDPACSYQPKNRR